MSTAGIAAAAIAVNLTAVWAGGPVLWIALLLAGLLVTIWRDPSHKRG